MTKKLLFFNKDRKYKAWIYNLQTVSTIYNRVYNLQYHTLWDLKSLSHCYQNTVV